MLLWQTSADLRMNAKTFQTLGGIVVASGAARAMMMVRYGSPGAIMTGAMALELVVMPALLAAHRVSLKRAS